MSALVLHLGSILDLGFGSWVLGVRLRVRVRVRVKVSVRVRVRVRVGVRFSVPPPRGGVGREREREVGVLVCWLFCSAGTDPERKKTKNDKKKNNEIFEIDNRNQEPILEPDSILEPEYAFIHQWQKFYFLVFD